jgi:DNA-binding transcriptional LysR family regulator
MLLKKCCRETPVLAIVNIPWLCQGNCPLLRWIEPLVFFPRRNNPALHDRIMACCHAVGCTPKISQEAILKVTAIALAEAGLGIALVPASAKSSAEQGSVRRLPVSCLWSSCHWSGEKICSLGPSTIWFQTVRKVRDSRL